jgi:hypothetical protein
MKESEIAEMYMKRFGKVKNLNDFIWFRRKIRYLEASKRKVKELRRFLHNWENGEYTLWPEGKNGPGVQVKNTYDYGEEYVDKMIKTLRAEIKALTMKMAKVRKETSPY